jgi:flagellar hook assembly protein FlgD
VANGTYYLKVDSVDPYGSVTSVTKPVNVNREISKVTVKIYNGAGELVRTLYAETTAPKDKVTNMTLSTSVIRPGGDGQDGVPSTVGIVLSTGTAAIWDGRADNGSYVADGTYYVDATMENAGSGTTTITRTLSVLGSKGSTGNAVVRPNLLTP